MSLPCLPPSTAVLPGVLRQQRLINPGKQTSPGFGDGGSQGCGIWWEPHKLQDWVAHHITPFPCLVPGKLLLKPHREMWHEPAARRCSCHRPQLSPRLLFEGRLEKLQGAVTIQARAGAVPKPAVTAVRQLYGVFHLPCHRRRAAGPLPSA